jgi:hypothetical protein
MDAKKEKKAIKAFKVMCASLDEDNWKYLKDEKSYKVEYIETGDSELKMQCKFFLDAEREMVRFLSKIPVEFPQEKIMEAAVACCLINNKIIFGSFDLDVHKGTIWFRMSNAMLDEIPGKDFFRIMRRRATNVIDTYNDRLLKLQKGEIKAIEIIKD